MFCNRIKREEALINEKELKKSLALELKKEMEMLISEYKGLVELEEKVDLFIGTNSGNKGDQNERSLWWIWYVNW